MKKLFLLALFVPAFAFAGGFSPTHHWHYDDSHTPQCDSGCHQDSDDCVPNVPTCVGDQTLVNNQCVDPTCTLPAVLNTDTHTCVTPPPPTCTDTQTLIDGQCVDNPPPPPVCVGQQTLVNNQCVDPTCTDTQTLDTDTHTCVDNPPPTDSGGSGGGGGGSDTTPPTTPSDSGGSGGGGNGPIVGSFGVSNGGDSGSGGFTFAASSTIPTAQCSTPLLTKYLKFGRPSNDPSEVEKLQAFLDVELSLNIPVSGNYDLATFLAVKLFQLRYYISVLNPWNLSMPTGFSYITTEHQINAIWCAALKDVPLPPLVPDNN